MLLQLNNITKKFADLPLFEKVNFTIQSSEKIGLIGENGSGKSTLFQIMMKQTGLDAGRVSHKKGLKIAYVAQLFPSSKLSVMDYLQQSFSELRQLKEQLRFYEHQLQEISADWEHALEVYGRLQQKFEEMGGYVLTDRIQTMLGGLGLKKQMDQPLEKLSGGERMRVELAKALLQEADLLLLDEPTNHLDARGIDWLENYLKNSRQTYMVISHDRYFLDQTTTKIVEIEDSQLVEYPGNYSKYVKLKQERMENIRKNYDLQQKEVQRLKKMIRRYRQWANEGDNEAFFKKAKEVEKRLAKLTIVRPPQKPARRLEAIRSAELSGKEVIIARNVGKIIGDRRLFSASSFVIYRKERVALLGNNGSGKSTLLKIILGEMTADAGEIRLGANVKVGYLPQKIVFENEDQRLLDFVRAFLPQEQKARQTLAHFGFSQEDVFWRLKDLSGGERVRLYLLKIMQAKINLLILDEPTNHLDIYAREEIEILLQDYQGTLITVTHDRYFLAKLFDKQLRIQDDLIIKKD